MQFDNQTTRNVADIVARILAGESAQQEPKMLEEELVGNQHKIDANKNNKIDAHDFKLLRKKKKVEEETEEIDETNHARSATKSEYQKSLKTLEKMPEFGAMSKSLKRRDQDAEYDKRKQDEFKKSLKKEETELAESHFKVGDKVRCKESGMDGEITKLDKEDGGEDEKYYTFKREDGKVMKKAPNELSKINEEVDKKKKDLPFTPDTVKKPVRNSDGTIQSPMSRARELAKQGLKRAMSKEETEIDEAMFPGTKEYEKKFGQSPQQKLKKKGDTVPTSQGDMTKTDKGVAHRRKFTEMIESYAEGGLKYIATLVQEEPDNEEYTKEVDEVKRKATQKKTPEDEARVAKASVQAVKNEETEIQVINADIANGVQFDNIEERSLSEPEMKKKEVENMTENVFYNSGESANKKPVGKGTIVKNTRTGIVGKAHSWSVVQGVPHLHVKSDNDSYHSPTKDWHVIDKKGVAEEVELDERSLSEPEMKKREEIVMSMKKKMPGFKERYGDRAKEVMYATAAKIAKEKA